MPTSDLARPPDLGLGIPGTVTETSLVLRAGLPFEDYQQVGGLLGRVGRAVQWWLGDWLRYGEATYGERFAQAAEATGYDADSLSKIARVSERVAPARRRAELSWSHHAEVASLDPPDQQTWLARAVREEWTRADLRQHLREARRVGADGDGTRACACCQQGCHAEGCTCRRQTA